MQVQVEAPTPVDSIPPPEQIRERLSCLFAEARLLRGLLRLAETKSRSPTTGTREERQAPGEAR